MGILLCIDSALPCRCDLVQLQDRDGKLVTLTRVNSTEDGEESVYLSLREAFNKLVPGAWQTYSGHISKGSKAGKHVPKGRGDSPSELTTWHKCVVTMLAWPPEPPGVKNSPI